MLKRITKSISIAVKVAVVGFEKSFRENEELDSILGYVDCLTGIPNRRAFERDKAKFKQGYSLVLIDIDKFKIINDNKGYVFGDTVLKRLAGILSEAVNSHGNAYRIGGDEFVLIIPKSKVYTICRHIRKHLRKRDSVTISQGVLLDLEGEITDGEICLADVALHQSKSNGKDRISTFLPAFI